MLIVLILLGAIAILIFGMKMTSEALQKMAGPQLRHLFGAMTGNRFSGVATGALITSRRAVMDAAPLLPLPGWLVGPLRYYQCANVWTCYHWTGFWKWVFHSHYFDTLLDECKKVWPYGKGRAVLDGYKDIYTHKLESIEGPDIHFWYGTKEAFVAKPQVEHLKKLHPETRVEVFKDMNHGQLLIDHPDEVAERILGFIRCV